MSVTLSKVYDKTEGKIFQEKIEACRYIHGIFSQYSTLNQINKI